MYTIYESGKSLQNVAEMYGVTRQSVYAMFFRRGFNLREKKKLPHIIVDGLKFTITKGGYYFCTTEDLLSLHKYVWEKQNGPIPNGSEIHHVDFNKLNNDISNLRMLTTADHSKLHSKIFNGAHNNVKVRCIETGEEFFSFSDCGRKIGINGSYVSTYVNLGKKIRGKTYVRI